MLAGQIPLPDVAPELGSMNDAPQGVGQSNFISSQALNALPWRLFSAKSLRLRTSGQSFGRSALGIMNVDA